MAAKTTLWKSYLEKRLEGSREKNTYRSLRVFDAMKPGYLLQGEKTYLNLCSNDYLGLSSDPSSLEEGKVLAEVLPSGSGASRLITGNLPIHEELEKLIAKWKGTEAALVFASGYQTNVGVITALLSKGDRIFSDKINHASIVDGCLLSGAALHRFEHGNLDDLQTLLQTKRGSKKIIITDGVFSMDGDIAPLPELQKIAKQYGALLLVDDAHASGVLGPDGSGTLAHFGMRWEENIIIMGTLSKAIGCQGGFICASNQIREYLINYSRPFIFSTGLSPWMAGMSHYNISRIRSEPEILARLRTAITVLREALQKHGFPIEDQPTPIIPILFGNSVRAVECAKKLYDKHIVALAIRPPSVPEGSERIRFSVSAAHNVSDLKKAAATLAGIVKKTGARIYDRQRKIHDFSEDDYKSDSDRK